MELDWGGYDAYWAAAEEVEGIEFDAKDASDDILIGNFRVFDLGFWGNF